MLKFVIVACILVENLLDAFPTYSFTGLQSGGSPLSFNPSALHTQIQVQGNAPSSHPLLLDTPHHSGGASVSNDHHGGVSIVGAGGAAQKGASFDLTKEGGGAAHMGLFGGSFISSGSHGKTGGYYQGGGGDDHALETAFSSDYSSLSGLQGGHSSQPEVSPVLYSSFKGEEHAAGLALHATGGHHQQGYHF